jgi:Dolichyl-phosphate-mannose-protein mannosyltransferase
MAIVEAWLGTLGLNGLLGLAAYLVARHGFRQPAGWPRTLGAAVLGWTWSTLGMEVLGSVGLLSFRPLLIWTASGLLAGGLLRVLDRSREAADPVPAGDSGWGWSATVALGFVLWGTFALGVSSVVMPVKVVSDGPIYHLYFAARWWKAGRLFLVATPFGENAATYFPAVGDLWYTWLMVGWGGDRLARVGQAPFLMASAMAAYAIARRLGADRSSALIATCWFASTSPLLLFTFEPNVDSIFIAGYLLAAYFFLRYALADDGPGSLILGGLAAGGALGSKAIGVVFVPILLLLAVLSVVWRGGSRRDRATALGMIVLAPMVMAGYWYGRNALLTGNPLYPLQFEAFGRIWLAGWYGPEVMRSSIYYIPFLDWRSLIDMLVAVLDPRLAPLWVAAIAGAWSWGRGDRRWSGWIWGCSALSIANVVLFWACIPYRTEQRFMLQALGLAAVPLAMTLRRSRALRWAAVALLGLHMLSHQTWPILRMGERIPWDLSTRIPNDASGPVVLPINMSESRGLVGGPRAWGPLVANGCLAFLIAWAWGRSARTPTPRRRIAAPVLTVAGVALLLAISWPIDIPPRLMHCPYFPDFYRGWHELELRSGPAGVRVAYAGTDLPYYLLGSGLRNEVRYVNVDEHRDWLLHDYHGQARSRGRPNWPNPRPGWDRIHPDYDAWLANLRAERIQILFVTRAVPEEGLHNIADNESFPIERRWADAHPETFDRVYGEAENDRNVRLYVVRPPRP